MHITVMSRKEAIRFSHDRYKEPTAMVSISTPCFYYDKFPKLGAAVQKIFCVNFYDIEAHEATKDIEPISDTIAMSMARFINAQIAANIEHLIIHCDAGLSRSAGTAKAVAKFYGIPDDQIKYKPDTAPNRTVQDAVYKALQTLYEPKPDLHTGVQDEDGEPILHGQDVTLFDRPGHVEMLYGAYGIVIKEPFNIEAAIWERYGFNVHACLCDNFISFWELAWNLNIEDSLRIPGVKIIKHEENSKNGTQSSAIPGKDC